VQEQRAARNAAFLSHLTRQERGREAVVSLANDAPQAVNVREARLFVSLSPLFSAFHKL